MRSSTRILGVLIAGGFAAEAAASGAGGAIYVPGRVKQASHTHVVGQRPGFACADHETLAPCTAEGCVHPSRNTFGWSQTRWRTWPGTGAVGQTPTRAETDATRDGVVELPPAEDEDRQAPPSIEDTDPPEDFGADPAVPAEGGGEDILIAPPIELPPVPGRPAPNAAPAAAPAGGENPPALPFGFGRAAPAEGFKAPERSVPRMLPVVTPNRRESDDAPPPLPPGLTRSEPAAPVRRLPRVLVRDRQVDTAVRTASAELPRR